MPARSTLARLQQALVFGLALAAIGWLGWHWPGRPLLAAFGALLIAFGFVLLLLAQFLLMWRLSGRDAPPRPTPAQLLRAWAAEVTHALRVFGWRQPFRWRAEPDHLEPVTQGRRGVVLIHGFVCNRGIWTPWMKRLRAQGHAYAAVNLEPVFGSIDDYAPIVDAAVRRVRDATGLPPVLVCHSMGGLAARAWLRSRGGDADVAAVITIGSPHHGTWLARFSQAPNGRQMRQDSPWLRQLEQDEARQPAVPFTCWYTNCDNIVFPTPSGMRPGADNRLLPGVGHLELAFRPELMDVTMRQIAGL